MLGSSAGAREGLGPPTFRTDTRLILVPVTVTDRRGSPIMGLTAESFTVLDGNLEQNIVSFSQENVPCSVGVIFDISGSMKYKLSQAKAALHALFRYFEPKDEAMLMSVSDRPSILTGFTSDFGSVTGSVMFAEAGGNTALVDTIYLALAKMQTARNPRKALLVISDGVDNHSRYSKGELMSAASEADVEIHSIAILEDPAAKKAIELQEESRGRAFLNDTSQRNGGMHLVVRNESEMNQAAVNIGRMMRSQYIIGYHPSGNHLVGKWHAIQVKLGIPETRVHARHGYFWR